MKWLVNHNVNKYGGINSFSFKIDRLQFISGVSKYSIDVQCNATQSTQHVFIEFHWKAFQFLEQNGHSIALGIDAMSFNDNKT